MPFQAFDHYVQNISESWEASVEDTEVVSVILILEAKRVTN